MTFLFDHDVPQHLSYLLLELGHKVTLLRQVLPVQTPDEQLLSYCADSQQILLTCNRDDFLHLAQNRPTAGVIVVVRRRTRAAERAALLSLLQKAGEDGLRKNINFA